MPKPCVRLLPCGGIVEIDLIGSRCPCVSSLRRPSLEPSKIVKPCTRCSFIDDHGRLRRGVVVNLTQLPTRSASPSAKYACTLFYYFTISVKVQPSKIPMNRFVIFVFFPSSWQSLIPSKLLSHCPHSLCANVSLSAPLVMPPENRKALSRLKRSTVRVLSPLAAWETTTA